MYTQNYKFKIFLFFLKNKCKNGNKCPFKLMKLNEIERLIINIIDIEIENDLLKKELNKTKQKDNNIKDKSENFLESDVHALRKPLYSSFFSNNIVDTKANYAHNGNDGSKQKCIKYNYQGNEVVKTNDESNYNQVINIIREVYLPRLDKIDTNESD